MKLCVHGIGYIGLATAALFANAGHEVVGYDPDERLVSELRADNPRTTEDELRAFVLEALDREFEPTTEPVEADCHLVCVPTPYDEESRRADLTYVEAAGRTVADLLRPGDLVVLESTVPPGTTEGVFATLLETSGLTAGVDFALAHCPEMVLPGNITYEIVHNDRIVGGVDGASTDRVVALYEPLVEGAIHRAPDATTAEFAKLAQNAYRDVNVAFANELARVAHDYGIRSRDAIALANVHPRVDVLNPGPGVGGHCLPIDPWFLGQSSDSLDLVESARRVNEGMVDFVADLLEAELGALAGASVAVLGVAYKGNVDDSRHSPGLRFADRLRAVQATSETELEATATDGGQTDADDGVDVRLSDPYVDDHDGTLGLVALDDALEDADAVVVTAAHDAFRDLDPERVRDLVARPLVVDTLACLDAERWRAAGFDYVEV
ncbi:UDP-N-acetyl-D-mannosaminuronic acid dehydrogenase [Halogranum amylolyticum]|uniref:UDP-N-acetyl-D-mannosamine dehydrogenase n=1 Tax=Halogranum amylolyticum TaxID=660520 RepID=A0A1H8N064_9EURY|nr:nucleotide sugar dehydrogenase [Halogranum amylolyticum]SEO23041.1 UDP-N-acetyl-D-mannosaminuronic acid dehydrogenase [Halogranum amylolyticum]